MQSKKVIFGWPFCHSKEDYMIKTSDAIAAARALIGTPYSELDCINLIKKIIRTAPGGDKSYTTAGTNALWDSFFASAKYKDLTWRQESLDGAAAGMLAFKSDGEDVHHVGLVTGDGTVIHSSSTKGGIGVIETALDSDWSKLAIHRLIQAQEADVARQEEVTTAYKAVVALANPDSYLNVRNEPGTGGMRIGKVHDGTIVTVQSMNENEWAFITYAGGSGYVDGSFLLMLDEADTEKEAIETTTLINDLTGDVFVLMGKWRVAED